MFYRGKYTDHSDAREMGLKRQRLMDQGSSFFGTNPGSSYIYNPPPLQPPPSYSYLGQPPPFPVVRMRGLPFDCTESDITEFFDGLDVIDVLFVHKGGKFTGEAFCVLGYPLQVNFALQRNRQNIGKRYVEVFRSRKDEYYKAIANEVSDTRGSSPRRPVLRARSYDEGKDTAEHTGFLRLRGLPFSASKEDIIDFFKDFVVLDEKIKITATADGRPTGEAYVEFANAKDSKAAMSRDRMTLGNRYIELFASSREELDEAISRGGVLPKTADGKDLTVPTGVLRMRGLPFSAGKDDILEFFRDFSLSENLVHITSNFEGRPTGEAFVEFTDPEDAKAALAKDRMTLGSRYIELFPSSREELKESVSRGR